MHQDFTERFLAGRSGRLLDMGCGLGFFLKVASGYPNWEVFGCEISAPAVQYARARLGLHNVMCTRLEDADFPPGSLDIITMWDVIDHILQPDPLLRRCHALLGKGGICFIRTPNLSTQLLRARLTRRVRGMQPTLAYLMPRDHLHIYSAVSIRRLLERNGFSCVQFVHMHPIQGVSASGALARVVKNVCFEVLRALAILSMGALNYDTLFVVARKDP
jgi:2-polyprenyl-3-methyl-5-hydroxy-6-metoxy-1,4-benzoquinol methylase